MATLQASGTQAATVTTEHTLTTLTTSAVMVFEVDRGAMVANDVLVLRVYGKTLTGGTERLWVEEVFYGAPLTPGDAKVTSIPIISDIEIRCTLLQSHGTSRSFPWKVTSP
jgi:hypothetical protein